VAPNSNPEKVSGGPNEVIGGGLFVGLSSPGLLGRNPSRMNDDAIVFAMANPPR
jgi:malic enzyme